MNHRLKFLVVGIVLLSLLIGVVGSQKSYAQVNQPADVASDTFLYLPLVVKPDEEWQPFNDFSFDGSPNGGSLTISTPAKSSFVRVWLYEYPFWNGDLDITPPVGWQWDNMVQKWWRDFPANTSISFSFDWEYRGGSVGVSGAVFESAEARTLFKSAPDDFGAAYFPHNPFCPPDC